jgi:hypothetical protein
MFSLSVLTRPSISRWKYALQRDNPIEHQVGLFIFVRLASTLVSDYIGGHGPARIRVFVYVHRRAGVNISRGDIQGSRLIVCRHRPMRVSGHFTHSERMGRLAILLTHSKSGAHMDWNPTAQIGQREGRLAITSKGGAKQRKQSLVLIDGQKLSITKRPALGSEVPGYEFQFRHVWRAHVIAFLS